MAAIAAASSAPAARTIGLGAGLGGCLDADPVARPGRLADDRRARAQAVDGRGYRVEAAAGGERHVAEAHSVSAPVLRAQLHLDRDERRYAHHRRRDPSVL